MAAVDVAREQREGRGGHARPSASLFSASSFSLSKRGQTLPVVACLHAR